MKELILSKEGKVKSTIGTKERIAQIRLNLAKMRIADDLAAKSPVKSASIIETPEDVARRESTRRFIELYERKRKTVLSQKESWFNIKLDFTGENTSLKYEYTTAIDYRKESIDMADLTEQEWKAKIGSIVVVKTQIFEIQEVSRHYIKVWGCPGFPLFPKDPAHKTFIKSLSPNQRPYYWNPYVRYYLRGRIYFNKYEQIITIRPLKEMPFLVGIETLLPNEVPL
jgi:hypothetical protein